MTKSIPFTIFDYILLWFTIMFAGYLCDCNCTDIKRLQDRIQALEASHKYIGVPK